MRMTMNFSISRMDSPVGPLELANDAEGRVRGVSFGGGVSQTMARIYPGVVLTHGSPQAAIVDALSAYFGGDLAALRRVPWTLDGAWEGDGFRGRVWRALAEITTGTTITYGEMAKRAGEPGAAQAAGIALNRNPIPVILPCHRVIGIDGSMVGFGGGLERKTWLLRHEGAILI